MAVELTDNLSQLIQAYREHKSTSYYRPDIDGLRAVAVTPVVLFHAGFLSLSGGFVGVDIFFVISGYLITGIIVRDLERGEFSLAAFYERRARRILPALFFVILSTLVTGWFLYLPSSFEFLARSAIYSTLFSSNIFFWIEAKDYFAQNSDYFSLLHTWSLAVEEQFYIMYPPLLMVLARLRFRPELAIAALTIASLFLTYDLMRDSPSAAFFLAPTRVWELGLGALLALGSIPQVEGRLKREFFAATGLMAIVFAVFYIERESAGLALLIPCVGAATLIHVGSAGPNFVYRLLSIRPIVFIGLISYSLYLWHWPIFAFLREYYGDVVLPGSVQYLAIAFTLVLSVLSWAFIERPFRNRANFKRIAIFSLSGAGMALLVAISGAILIEGGFQKRFPEHDLKLIEAARAETSPLTKKCFEKNPSQGLCRFGADRVGPPDFIFWGDSHTDALMPGLDLAAKEAGRSGLYAGKRGCAPLLGASWPSKKHHDCEEFNLETIEEVGKQPNIKMVILHARWALFQTGQRLSNEHGEPVFLVDKQHSAPSSETNAIVFEAGLRKTVKAIRDLGRTTIIIAGTPEMEWDVPMKLRALFQRRIRDIDLPNIETFNERNARVSRLFEEFAADARVRIVPLADLLCQPECEIIKGGYPLYRDDDHLSVYGARWLAPALADRIWGYQVNNSSN